MIALHEGAVYPAPTCCAFRRLPSRRRVGQDKSGCATCFQTPFFALIRSLNFPDLQTNAG